MSISRTPFYKKILTVSLALMMLAAPAAVLPAAADTVSLNVCAASRVSVSSKRITLYAMDDWAEKYISIPSSYCTKYQLKVTGAKNVTYHTSSKYLSVSSRGMIKLNPENCYWYRSKSGALYGTTAKNPALTAEKITKHIDYGQNTVTVKADGQTFNVRVDIKDYVAIYVNKVMDDYIKANITSGMNTYQKIVKIAAFVAARNYDEHYCSAEGLVVTGGADCWGCTETAIVMAKKLGLKAWGRDAGKDGSTGSDAGISHKNAVITDGRNIYILEAGYSGKAPRKYDIIKRSSFWSCRPAAGGKGIELYQYDGETVPEVLKIPSKIDGKTVTGLADDIFALNTGIKQAVLPDTLQYIGVNAFYGCTSLEKINIPVSLRTIDERAFADCTRLKSMTTAGSRYKFAGGVLYKGTTAVSCPNAANVSIAAGTKEIANGAFSFNSQLVSAVIPSSVERIGEGAFAQCKKLGSVTINSTKIRKIPSFAFAYNSMKYFTVPDSVTEICANAFAAAVKGREAVLVGKAGGAAESYAKANGHTFLDIKKSLINTSKLSCSETTAGGTVSVTAAYTGGKAPYRIEVYKKHQSEAAFSANLAAGNARTVSFKADKAGSYTVKTVITDGFGMRQEKLLELKVKTASGSTEPANTSPQKPLVNKSYVSSDTTQVKRAVTIFGSAEGGSGPYRYTVKYRKPGEIKYSFLSIDPAAKKFSFIPDKCGAYSIQVIVTDSKGKTAAKVLSLTVK